MPAQRIIDAARVYATNGPALTFWAMGLNQSTSGVDNSLALINLALATGNIGRPGSGPFSLTGQSNAMGGREAGGLAGSLPGHRSVADAADRADVERSWGVPAGRVAARPGLTAVEMVEALERGQLKVLWIACTNPLVSLPNSERVRAAFARAELVIVQDAYHPTETTEVGGPDAPGGAVGGARGHDDEQRAAHLPAGAGRRPARRGAARLADHQPRRRRARPR